MCVGFNFIHRRFCQNTAHLAEAEALQRRALVVRQSRVVTRPAQHRTLHGAAHLEEDDETEMDGRGVVVSTCSVASKRGRVARAVVSHRGGVAALLNLRGLRKKRPLKRRPSGKVHSANLHSPSSGRGVRGRGTAARTHHRRAVVAGVAQPRAHVAPRHLVRRVHLRATRGGDGKTTRRVRKKKAYR